MSGNAPDSWLFQINIHLLAAQHIGVIDKPSAKRLAADGDFIDILAFASFYDGERLAIAKGYCDFVENRHRYDVFRVGR